MISLLKKTVLSVTILGCALGLQADEKKESNSTASTGAVALATGAMIAGAACVVGGGIGLSAQMNASDIDLPPSIAGKVLAAGPYALLLLIPGILLASGGALYCFKSAKGIWSKIRATLGSTLTLGGSLALAVAGLGYASVSAQNNTLSTQNWSGFKDAAWYLSHNIEIPNQTDMNQGMIAAAVTAACGAGLALLGYMIQPTDNGEKQA